MDQEKSAVPGWRDAIMQAEHRHASDPAMDEMKMLQMMSGPWVFQTIYVAAKLGLPDLLGDDPVPIDQLASMSQAP